MVNMTGDRENFDETKEYTIETALDETQAFEEEQERLRALEEKKHLEEERAEALEYDDLPTGITLMTMTRIRWIIWMMTMRRRIRLPGVMTVRRQITQTEMRRTLRNPVRKRPKAHRLMESTTCPYRPAVRKRPPGRYLRPGKRSRKRIQNRNQNQKEFRNQSRKETGMFLSPFCLHREAINPVFLILLSFWPAQPSLLHWFLREEPISRTER